MLSVPSQLAPGMVNELMDLRPIIPDFDKFDSSSLDLESLLGPDFKFDTEKWIKPEVG